MAQEELDQLVTRLDRVANRNRERLESLQDDAERSLVRIFARAEGGVLDRLQRLFRAGRISSDQVTAFLADIDRMLQRVLVTGGRNWVDEQFSLAYTHALDRTRDVFLTGENLRNVRLIDDDAIRAALVNFAPEDDLLFRSGLQRGYNLVREIDRELAQHLQDVMVRHVALGSTTNEVADELIEEGILRPIGRVPLEQRAQMIARTELARVSEEASAVRSQAVGIDLFRWSALVGDPRTADDSLRRHGRIKTRAQWVAYRPDRFSGVPPIRPNDRCTLVPMRRNWIRGDAARNDFDRAVRDDRRLLVAAEDRNIIAGLEGIENDFL